MKSFVPGSSDVTLDLVECDNESAQQGFLDGTYDVILFVSKDVRPAISFDIMVEAPAYCLLPAAHPLATQSSVSLRDISKEPLVVLNRPVASAYYRGLFASQDHDISIAAYANSTEMVRSLVGAGHGLAVLNMQPLTTTTYSGDAVIGLPISDPLPPLPLAIAYDKSRPRRLVGHFVDSCRKHFAKAGPEQCIVEK